MCVALWSTACSLVYSLVYSCMVIVWMSIQLPGVSELLCSGLAWAAPHSTYSSSDWSSFFPLLANMDLCKTIKLQKWNVTWKLLYTTNGHQYISIKIKLVTNNAQWTGQCRGHDIYGHSWALTATAKTTDAFHNMEFWRETLTKIRLLKMIQIW